MRYIESNRRLAATLTALAATAALVVGCDRDRTPPSASA